MNRLKNIGDTIRLQLITPKKTRIRKIVKNGYGFIIMKNAIEEYEIFILKAGGQRNFITHAYSDCSSLVSSKIVLIEKFNKKRKWTFKYEEDALIKDITDTIRV
jgi:hypothetical protein